MLHDVNLLPWREEKRAQYRQRFVHLVILGVLAAVGMQWGAGWYLQQEQNHQSSRLAYLKQYITQLDKRISALKMTEREHEALLTRLKVVEGLQQDRNKTTELMNLIPQWVPEGVYVDKISLSGDHVELTGISDSTARLATMLDNLESSPNLVEVEMHSIVHGKARFGEKFQIFNVSFYFSHTPWDDLTEVQDG